MKRSFVSMIVMMLLFHSFSAISELSDFKVVTSSKTHKVILDTDMSYLSDDSYAMLMLLQADAAKWIDLLGITSTGANVTVAEGTTAILNQLEALGRGEIPVYMGTDIPIMGFHDDATLRANGLTRITSMQKVIKYGQSLSYDNLGDLLDRTWKYSSLKPKKDKAWEFMINQVNKYPGQVTIIEIGACTNVALAIRSDPAFAGKTAGIYYMGGAIDVPGNDTPCAERNWYYDPESVKICLESDFPIQVVVPHDISYNQVLTKKLIEGIINAGDTAFTRYVRDYAYPEFKRDPNRRQRLWDAQVPGIFLVPDLISKTDERNIAIITDMGYSYGESVAWAKGQGPATATTCRVVYDVHGEDYWRFVAELFGTKFSK